MTADQREPEVIDAELVEPIDLDALTEPLQHPPALRAVCACGKDGTPYAHGAIPYGGRVLRPFTCTEVLEIAASVAAAQRSRRRWFRLFGRN